MKTKIKIMKQFSGFGAFPYPSARSTQTEFLTVFRQPGGGGGGGGALSIMAYTGRLRPKGVPFLGFRYIKG